MEPLPPSPFDGWCKGSDTEPNLKGHLVAMLEMLGVEYDTGTTQCFLFPGIPSACFFTVPNTPQIAGMFGDLYPRYSGVLGGNRPLGVWYPTWDRGGRSTMMAEVLFCRAAVVSSCPSFAVRFAGYSLFIFHLRRTIGRCYMTQRRTITHAASFVARGRDGWWLGAGHR